MKHTSIWCIVNIWNLAGMAGKSTISHNISVITVSSSIPLKNFFKYHFNPFDPHVCHLVTAIRHPVPDRVKPVCHWMLCSCTQVVGVKGLNTETPCRPICNDWRWLTADVWCPGKIPHTTEIGQSSKYSAEGFSLPWQRFAIRPNFPHNFSSFSLLFLLC